MTGTAVHGYRSQAPEQIATVNGFKQAEERILRLLDDLAAGANVDPRWLSIGRTQIEQGFMAVNRAVFRPGRVTLPEDALPPDPREV